MNDREFEIWKTAYASSKQYYLSMDMLDYHYLSEYAATQEVLAYRRASQELSADTES